MKKVLYAAMMALVMCCFIGCTPRASMGSEPKLDQTNSTLDGQHYDNTTYKCWKLTWETVEKETGVPDVREHGVDYYWTTELMAQYEKALFLYSHNISASGYGQSYSLSGTCTLEETPDDESTCYSNDY